MSLRHKIHSFPQSWPLKYIGWLSLVDILVLQFIVGSLNYVYFTKWYLSFLSKHISLLNSSPSHGSLRKRLPDPMALNTTYTTYMPMTHLFTYLSKSTLLRSTIIYIYIWLPDIFTWMSFKHFKHNTFQMEFLIFSYPITQPQRCSSSSIFPLLTKDTSGYLVGQARNLVSL